MKKKTIEHAASIVKKSRAEYWKDWYWNKGGREKVMSKRYINEYERTRKRSV